MSERRLEERIARLERQVDELLGDSTEIECPSCGERAVYTKIGNLWVCQGYCGKAWVRRELYVEAGHDL